MSILAEQVFKAIKQLPLEDQEPVVGSILLSTGPNTYNGFRRRVEALQARGSSEAQAFVSAFDAVLSGPEGAKALRVLVGAAVREQVRLGELAPEEAKSKAREYVRGLVRVGEISEELGDFGISAILAIIGIATSVATSAAGGISGAIRNMKARRRALKTKLTPVNTAEINDIVAATVKAFSSFREAEPTLLTLIEQVRPGRRGWLLDPATGDARGSKVNERADVQRAWEAARAELIAQREAERGRKNLTYGIAAAVGAAALVGVASVLMR